MNETQNPVRDRVVYIVRDGEKRQVPFMDIKAGERFWLHESDGTLVAEDVAVSDAFEKDGVGGVEVEKA